MIRIFKRKAWRREGDKYVPHGAARKTTVQYATTVSEAREICTEHNRKRYALTGHAGYNFMFYEFEREIAL